MVQQISQEERALAAGYVLGDLDTEETQVFIQMLQQNEALVQEVKALQVALRLAPQALPPVTPPLRLRERIVSAHAVTEPPLERPVGFLWGKIIAGIAMIAALLLAADNWRLRQAFVAQSESVDSRSLAAILQRPNSRVIPIRREAGNAEAVGTLLFTPGQWQQVIVSLGNLPPLPPDQIYRMWLTLNNGQVIPCGEFNTDAEGSVFVELNPTEKPPQGTKAAGIFVTIDSPSAPLQPRGDRVLAGTI